MIAKCDAGEIGIAATHAEQGATCAGFPGRSSVPAGTLVLRFQRGLAKSWDRYGMHRICRRFAVQLIRRPAWRAAAHPARRRSSMPAFVPFMHRRRAIHPRVDLKCG